ncbi:MULTISPECIES: phage holin family protein [unclassified Neisseria]|uniref:phage holin family protein n=1 Tax=unclassified Neisseria TaxID=2623750 RepID=UPI00266539E7|nr:MULTISPECIES: phage holin family protein [unclassified Neisseria]MDO1508882.1 phage holin family protein [Neisseria sp. MVDL19-042950]MDO1515141.1 phage holin family protein [Neisseria sp. MVDL18-041461]MDO1562501.1 phage holin family protein [Neisseria sp. MVDL20-010259]
MNVKQNISHFKILLGQGVDLLLLRVQILGLDLTEQAGSLLRILAAIMFIGALFSLSIISLLFGLDHVLSDTAKIWVFFGISGGCLLVIVGLTAWIINTWNNKNAQVAATLNDLRQDIAYLRGKAENYRRENNE